MSLSKIWIVKCVYAIPTVLVDTFLLFERKKFFYGVCSRARYIDVAVIKQFCYQFCFFTHVTERYPFIIACTIFVRPILFFFYCVYYPYTGATLWRSWLRHCAASRKVAGSIPDGVIEIFHWHNLSGRTMALGLTQPLTEMSTRNISWG